MLGSPFAREREEAIRSAEVESAKEVRSKRRSKAAELYVKVMKKVAAEGEGFTRREANRTKKMLEGSAEMSEGKKEELREKVNVLRSITWWGEKEEEEDEQEQP